MEKPNLSITIRDKLEASINAGELMPGDPLDERALAEKFGVSRTPIREAMHLLSAQGLLQAVPRQGIFVARMSVHELLALFEFLAELEGTCARFAAKRITSSQLAGLKDALSRGAAVAADDAEAYDALNTEFHEGIYEAAHNTYIAQQVRHIRRRTRMYRRTAFDQHGRALQSVQEHTRILAAIEAKDEEGAYREAQSHIAVGGRGFAEFVSTLPPHLRAD